MKKFVVIQLIREDWDNPTVKQVEAEDESGAYDKFAEDTGYETEELEEGEEDGEIIIIIHEVV